MHKFDYIVSLGRYIAKVRNPPCEINIFVLQQQQNLGGRFGTSKMHLSQVDLAAVRFKEVFLLLLIHC